VRQAIDAHRQWFSALLRELLAADGHPSPADTADMLAALWDGVLVGSHIGGLADVTALARDAVGRVLDGGGPPKSLRRRG
jgi:hypothetical protein